MKKLKFGVALLSLCGLFALASCTSGDKPTKDDIDEQIQNVYTSYVANGGTLTYDEWLASIIGAQGEKGETGAQGEKGETGAQGEKGETGAQGEK